MPKGGGEQGQPTEDKKGAANRNQRQKDSAAGGGHVETAREENLSHHKTPSRDANGGARPAGRDGGQQQAHGEQCGSVDEAVLGGDAGEMSAVGMGS